MSKAHGKSMSSSSQSSIAQRPAGGGRRPAAGSMHSHALRMNLFVLVRVLFQYLERVDKTVLDIAKEVSCKESVNWWSWWYQLAMIDSAIVHMCVLYC